MAETSDISWTDATFNPWIGCAKVSPGCDHCYAERSTPSRTMKILWGPQEQRKRTSAGNWGQPVRWNAAHSDFFAAHGRRRRVFCASLADVFDNRADPQWRRELWELIRVTPNLDWLLLTKRIGNVAGMLPADWGRGYDNVWLGISVVNQEEVRRDVYKLVSVPARIRWLSMEPLLEAVSFEGVFADQGSAVDRSNLLERIDWVVAGGESGPAPRLVPEEAYENLRDQCDAVGIPYFYKQRGGKTKEKGGCLLGGVEVKAWPAV